MSTAGIQITRRTIDLNRVIADRNAALLRLIPRAILRYLRRIVHQEELNEGLFGLREARDLDFISGALDVLGVTATINGDERFPRNGRIIVVSNHPLGGLDGMVLINTIGRRYGQVLVPANDLLLNLPNIRKLLVPVNKHGSNRGNLSLIEECFAGGAPILHFPAGLCSRRRGGRVRDLGWQKSFIVRARRHDRAIIPVHFSGENSRFFYRLANLRRWSGIKANLEMVYLVDEMFKQRGAALSATIGRPISSSTFDRRLDDWSWARSVRRHVYRLGEDPDAIFEDEAVA